MRVVSLETGDSREEGMIKAGFSDGSFLTIKKVYLDEEIFPERNFDFGFPYTDRELSAGEEEALSFAALCCRAEKTALRLIARAEQNSFGLAAKLEYRGFGARAVKAVLSHLRDRDLLDDARFAERWIRSRLALGKAVSPQWLLASLRKRGIDRNSSAGALGAVLDPETEYALLLRYLDKETKKNNKKARLFRAHLRYEGFSSEVLDRYFDV